MKKDYIFIIICIILCNIAAFSQEKLEIEGAIIIKNAEDLTPAEGTIRFNTTTKDFEGWNGHQWMSLTRLREPGGGVTDVDGNTYTTVKLGTQEWMVENLKTTKYNDNTGITNITENMDWAGLNVSETGAWCYYDNDAGNNTLYGKLYNWYAVETDKLCPTGWHVPSDAEWTTLTDYLGGTGIAGGKMKTTGTIQAGTGYWQDPNTGATNESGFTGLPGGYRANEGSFTSLVQYGYWWSSTESSSSNAWYHNLNYINGLVDRDYVGRKLGFSVRCVRD